MKPARKPEPEPAADPIAALTAMLTELQHDVAELRAELSQIKAPQSPEAGRVPLRVAANLMGRSDEWLRQRVARGDIDGERVHGRWYVHVGDLAIPNRNAEPQNQDE